MKEQRRKFNFLSTAIHQLKQEIGDKDVGTRPHAAQRPGSA
jgi:hypothetical protein